MRSVERQLAPDKSELEKPLSSANSVRRSAFQRFGSGFGDALAPCIPGKVSYRVEEDEPATAWPLVIGLVLVEQIAHSLRKLVGAAFR